MKCRIKYSISPGCTLLDKTKAIFREIIQSYIGNYNLLHLQYTMDHPKFIVLNQIFAY